MTTFRTALAAALIALATPAATPVAAQVIEVSDPFAIISPAGNSGAAFMRLANPGGTDDRLVAAAADVSERVELHTHEEDDAGVMRMIEVAEGFPIPADGERLLERGGDHVMFLGLTRDLAEGDSITLTLRFETAGDVTLEVPVRAPMPAGHSHSHGADHDHGHSHSHD